MSKSLCSIDTSTCNIHVDEIITSICYQHGSKICKKCRNEKHKYCRPVANIQDDTHFNEISLENIEANIRDVSRVLEQMTGDKKNNLRELKEKEIDIKKTINKARQRINEYLDKLTRSLEIEIKSSHDTLIERIERSKNQIENKQDELKAISKDIHTIKYQSTDATINRDITELVSKQKMLESSVVKLFENDKQYELHLKLSEAVFGFENFLMTVGSIVISERCTGHMRNYLKAIRTNGTKNTDTSVQPPVKLILSNGQHEPGSLTLVGCFQTSILGKGVRIFRACFLPDNRLMLAGYQEKTLYVCNKNGHECKKVRVSNFPGGITIYNKSNGIMSAWQHGLQKIDLDTMKAGSVIKFHGECSAISSTGGQICVKNGEDHLKIVDINGKTVRKMPTKFNPWDVCLNDLGLVFYSNLVNSDVYCVFPDGSNYITYSNPDLLDPAGLILDNQSNLYITGSRSNNVHRISSSREVKEVILTEDDDIEKPSGLAFNKQTNELLIINNDFTSIRIYKIHMTM